MTYPTGTQTGGQGKPQKMGKVRGRSVCESGGCLGGKGTPERGQSTCKDLGHWRKSKEAGVAGAQQVGGRGDDV